MMGGMGMMVSGSPAVPAGTVALSPSHSADDGPVLAVGDRDVAALTGCAQMSLGDNNACSCAGNGGPRRGSEMCTPTCQGRHCTEGNSVTIVQQARRLRRGRAGRTVV
jgi:hypothetical protein